ncbi:hypothetical protein HG531_014006 [Fusarium graminearum]|nr:hypothetical protein HG531_014006 [Fusarium graminearum]
MDIDSLICLNGIGNAKVDELELTFDKNKVGGLKIRMDDIALMNSLQTLKHFLPVESHENWVEFCSLGVISLPQKGVEIQLSNLHKLFKSQQANLLLSVHLTIEQFDNSLHFAQFFQQVDFTKISLDGRVICVLQGNTLEGKHLAVFSGNTVNLSTATSAKTIKTCIGNAIHT